MRPEDLLNALDENNVPTVDTGVRMAGEKGWASVQTVKGQSEQIDDAFGRYVEEQIALTEQAPKNLFNTAANPSNEAQISTPKTEFVP